MKKVKYLGVRKMQIQLRNLTWLIAENGKVLKLPDKDYENIMRTYQAEFEDIKEDEKND